MNKWSELLIGLVLVLGAIIAGWYSGPGASWAIGSISLNFWHAGWEFLKGGIFWFVIMIGVLFILLGISDLKG